MSRRTASQARARRRLREVDAEVRARSEVAEGATEGSTRVAAGSSAAVVPSVRPSTRSEASGEVVQQMGEEGAPAGVVPTIENAASPARPSGAAVQRPGTRQRDPRLGRYQHVGAFLMHCINSLYMPRREVMQVAGLLPGDDPLLLLDYEGGLNALFEVCRAHMAGVAR
jgi:hypothetical protein